MTDFGASIHTRLSYVMTFGEYFNISSTQRKLGKKLVHQLKQAEREDNSCGERVEELRSRATTYFIKHLGADLTFEEVLNRPELA